MTVNRTRPLPHGTLRGNYRIAHNVLKDTRQALRTFDEAGHYEEGHEGICYWAGREEPSVTSLEAVVVPVARHGRFGVFVSAKAFAEVARRGPSNGPRYSCASAQSSRLRH